MGTGFYNSPGIMKGVWLLEQPTTSLRVLTSLLIVLAQAALLCILQAIRGSVQHGRVGPSGRIRYTIFGRYVHQVSLRITQLY